LAELCARKQHRTLSNFIEWAVEQSLSDVILDDNWQGSSVSVAEAERNYRLWDVHEADRVIRLALRYPYLLTIEGQIIWKLVREDGLFWKGSSIGNPSERAWQINEEAIKLPILREYWESLRADAKGIKFERRRARFDVPSDDTSS
jgi:hypothetical protein